MKKFNQLLVVTSMLFSSTSLMYAQLSGSYTVGSSGDYTTIGDAISDINSQGLSGDVILTISTGTYAEYVDLTNLNNGAFNVTLEGEDLDNTIISPTYEDTTPIAGIDLQDTDNITIRNITIRMPFESATATQEMFGIYVEDASNISVENTVILSVDGIEVVRSNNLDVFNTIVSAEKIAFEARASNSLNLVHNTFHTNQTGLISGNVGTQAAVRFEGDNGNVSLTNNIFSGVVPDEPNGNAAIAVLNNLENLEISTNFNLFDADFSMAVFGESGNTNVNGTTVFEEYLLTEWNALGLDLQSQSFSPTFLAGTDFRIGNEDFRFGTFITAYPTDIDGEARIEGSVDVGADQYCESIEVTESIESCESYEFDGLTLLESGEYFGEFVAINGCDSLVTLNLTVLEATAGSDAITAEGSYDWNGVIFSETGTYEQTLVNQVGCDSTAMLNLTIEPYFLEGNFIIGSSMEADFSNFTEAVADLQYATLTGDVGYSVEAGTYNETLKLSSINSGDHSISFIGEDNNTTILHPLEDIEESGSGILIDGTSNVTIQNMTLEMDNISDVQVSLNSNDTKGISVVNADNITLDNLSLRNDSEVSDYSSSQFYISSGLSITNVNDLTVSNSTFSGAGSHINLGDHSNVNILENTFQTAAEVMRNDPSASDDPTGSNLLIEGNEFTGPFDSGIELSLVEDIVIRSNELDGMDGNESSFGILSSENIDLTIEDNTIKNVEFGIILDTDSTAMVARNRVTAVSSEAFSADKSANLQVVNNFFGDIVILRRLFNFDFIHNTVVSGSSDQRFEVLYLEIDNNATGDLTARISNNIFVGNNQVAGWLIAFINLNGNMDFSLDLTLDHNLYYLDDDTGLIPLVNFVDILGSTRYNTLAEWQSAQSFDQNSQSFEPSFAGVDDFHISSDMDYRFGTFISDYTTDIDGETRIEGSVDVGADQFCVTVEALEFVEACESYEFDGITFTESGEYFGEFVAENGCDSLVTLNLTILEATMSEETVDACESFDWNGVTYEVSGIYQEMFTNAVGCDSTAVLNLTILESTSSEESVESCGSYEWNSTIYTATGIYEELFENSVGCDSTAVLNLTILEEPDNTVTQDGVILSAVDDPEYTYQWVDCDDNNSPVPGADESQLVPPGIGLYAVEVSNASCTVISDCYMIDWVTSTGEISDNQILIYPTVTSDYIKLELHPELGSTTVQVWDMTGVLLKEENIKERVEHQLSLPSMSGLYLIRVLSNDKVQTVRRVIKTN